MTAVAYPTAAGDLSIDFDSFWTATMANYSPEQAVKNYIEDRPILRILLDDFGHKDSNGGKFIYTSVDFGLNPTIKWFDGADVFDQTVSQTDLPLTYYFRYIGGSITITKTETLENRGQARIFDLFQRRYDQCMRSLNYGLAQQAYSDGSDFGGKSIQGLAAIISTTPTVDPTVRNVGGLSASNTFWRNSAIASFGSFAAFGVNGTSDDYWLRMTNLLTDGAQDRPTNLVSSQLPLEYYNRKLLQTVRVVDPTKGKTGDLSFGGLEYQGMPWEWDRLCPSGTAYWLNRKYLYFVSDPAMTYEWSAPLTVAPQLAFTRIVGSRLALVATNRMFQGVVAGVTA
jgi:hypothetical protein